MAADLFCGAGGLTCGLERAGIDVRVGIDIDPACEYPYTANNRAKFLLKSVAEIRPCDFKGFWPRKAVRLLAGCAPCQTFSRYNQKASPEDGRWRLLMHFARLIRALTPELVTMENVSRLKDHGVFADYLAALFEARYNVSYQVVSCEAYGIPQRRQRLVLLASRLGSIRLLSPAEFGVCLNTSVEERIADLPELKAGEACEDDPLHQASTLSNTNMERIKASKPGGTWRDWKEALVADCHRKNTGKTYPSVYGRMRWDEPAPTITTQFYGFGNGRFGHPEQHRAISLREGAILQSFPKDYEFTRPGERIFKKSVGRLIGNAVPPKLAEVIGTTLVEHVKSCGRRGRTKGAHAPQSPPNVP